MRPTHTACSMHAPVSYASLIACARSPNSGKMEGKCKMKKFNISALMPQAHPVLVEEAGAQYSHTCPPLALAHIEKSEQQKFARIPSTGIHTEAARLARLDFIKTHTQSDLLHVQKTSFEAKKLSNNIESFIGSIEVPVGIAGPLKINGRRANGVFYAPIATSEGALIASMSRGAYALSTSGGVTTRVLAQRMIPGGMALASGLILGFIFSSGALGMLLTGPLAENYGFPTVLVMTTGLVLLASPLAWMLREKTTRAAVILEVPKEA